MNSRWRKGVVLMQTLVMAVILSMIAVMLMKWVLARYMLAARNYRSTEARARSQFYASDQFSNWNLVNYPANFAGIPTTGDTRLDNSMYVGFTRTASPMTITITSNSDEPTP